MTEGITTLVATDGHMLVDQGLVVDSNDMDYVRALEYGRDSRWEQRRDEEGLVFDEDQD